MNLFTISDVENLTGIKAHTLRIWEKRYGLMKQKGRKGQHRLYGQVDVKKLLRFSFLYHSGLKISAIAGLPDHSITEMTGSMEIGKENYRHVAALLLEAVIDFDEEIFTGLLSELSGKIGFRKTMEEVCFPLLRKIGHLDAALPAVQAMEHFSRLILQNRVITETGKIKGLKARPVIALICPEGGSSELTLLYINYTFRQYGWPTLYLGIDFRKKDLKQLALLPHTDFVYVYLSPALPDFYADDYLEQLCRTYPDRKILVSGEGMRSVQRSFLNLFLLKTAEALYSFILNVPA